MADALPEFLTVAEVAEILKLNPQTIRNWIDAGKLPAYRVGRRVRVGRLELETLIRDGRTSSAPTPPPKDKYTAQDFWDGVPLLAEPENWSASQAADL